MGDRDVPGARLGAVAAGKVGLTKAEVQETPEVVTPRSPSAQSR